MRKANPVAPNAWQHACRHALQWRLLLLWVLLLAMPALIFALPIWRMFGNELDYSVHAASIAEHVDISAIGDMVGVLTLKSEALTFTALAAALLTALLSPLLSGMAVTALRAPMTPGFGELMHGAMKEYWRMMRMLVWGAIPLGIALACGVGLHKAAGKYAEKAILEADADLVRHLALALALLFFVIAHAMVDAARADFALDSRRRSAFKALWRGFKMVLCRPFLSLGYYLSISVIGLVLALALAWLRINLPHVNMWGFCAGLVIMQMMVVVMAWMRNARLFALYAIAQAQLPSPKSL